MIPVTQDATPRAMMEALPRATPQAVLQHASAEDFSVYQPAGFVLRWYALTLDLTFAGPLDVLCHLPFQRYLEKLHAYGHTTEYWILTVALTAIPIMLYLLAPTMIWGQTLGKRIVGIRVVREDLGAELDFGAVFLRETVGRALSVLTLGLGFLLVLFDVRKRAMHDYIAGTCVVSYKVKP